MSSPEHASQQRRRNIGQRYLVAILHSQELAESRINRSRTELGIPDWDLCAAGADAVADPQDGCAV
jgi:hypothetical protein